VRNTSLGASVDHIDNDDICAAAHYFLEPDTLLMELRTSVGPSTWD